MYTSSVGTKYSLLGAIELQLIQYNPAVVCNISTTNDCYENDVIMMVPNAIQAFQNT